MSGRWWFQFRKLGKSFWVLSSIHILFSITVSQHSISLFYNRCIYFLNYLCDINYVGYISNCDRTNIGLNDSAWKKFWELYVREVCTHTYGPVSRGFSLVWLKHLQSHSRGLSFAWLVYVWGVAKENSNYHEVHVHVWKIGGKIRVRAQHRVGRMQD